MKRIAKIVLLFCLAQAMPLWASEFSTRGNVDLELRAFTEEPADPLQHGDNVSISAEPEFHWDWNDGGDELLFRPFVRWDDGDEERSHFDIREFLWLHLEDGWELRSGIGEVFWGVAESQHLVDIVNQTDAIENIDGEDKLGQPMVWLSMPRNWGLVDLFLLPGFRERSFAGVNGRPRTQPRVDTDNPVYESEEEQDHVDLAARWSHYVGSVDFGLSWFRGTSRDARLEPIMDDSGEVLLVPHYDQIEQQGLDLQSILGSWLLKLELIRRSSEQFEDYTALTTGFEYTFVSVLDSRNNLGILAEYLYDSRPDGASGPFQDDLFVGLRLVLNDIQSTEVLAGVIGDLDNGARLFNLEASRRIGSHWKLSVEARLFSSIPDRDPLSGQRQDDYVEIGLGYYF